MTLSVFLSRPRPHLKRQQDFIDIVTQELMALGLKPRCLGVTDYDPDVPMVAIRKLMLESNGLITIAFARTYIEKGIYKANANINVDEQKELSDYWLTSPWSQIEPAMAFQLGMPIIIFREKEVLEEGVLEKGMTAIYLPEFDLNEPYSEYFKREEWKQLITKWHERVIQYHNKNSHGLD